MKRIAQCGLRASVRVAFRDPAWAGSSYARGATRHSQRPSASFFEFIELANRWTQSPLANHVDDPGTEQENREADDEGHRTCVGHDTKRIPWTIRIAMTPRPI